MAAHELRMQEDLHLAQLVGGGLVRLHVGRDRRLGIHHDLAAAGQLHDEVGAQLPVVALRRLLLDEVAMQHHPGHLDHAAQLDLAPAPTHVGLAQRLHEVRRLVAQLGLHLGHVGELLADLAVGLDARLLQGADLFVHLVQRGAHRGDQRLDRDLALLEVALGALLEFRERGAREIEEGLVVALQRIGRERLEAILQGALRLGDELHLLLRLLALLLEARVQLRRALAGLARLLGEARDRQLALADQAAQLIRVASALFQRGAALHRFEELAAKLGRIALQLRGLHAVAQRLLAHGGELRFELRGALLVVGGPGAVPEVGDAEPRGGARQGDEKRDDPVVHASILDTPRLKG